MTAVDRSTITCSSSLEHFMQLLIRSGQPSALERHAEEGDETGEGQHTHSGPHHVLKPESKKLVLLSVKTLENA